MMLHSLSAAQKRVLKLLKGGGHAVNTEGFVVSVDGKYVCNTATMAVLEGLALVERVAPRTWILATGTMDTDGEQLLGEPPTKLPHQNILAIRHPDGASGISCLKICREASRV